MNVQGISHVIKMFLYRTDVFRKVTNSKTIFKITCATIVCHSHR